MLVYSGYVYRLKKSTIKVKYWVCQSETCAAKVHTNINDHFIKANGHHRHMPAPERIELRDMKNRVKERVQDETVSVPKIYEEELARSNLSSVALTLAPLTVEASKLLIYLQISICSCTYRIWFESYSSKKYSTITYIGRF